MIGPARRVAIACLAMLMLGVPGRADGQAPPDVVYVVTFPSPEHHWLQVEATFSSLGGEPLRARMSRSSPGRYAVHEFAKNIFAIEARSGAGRALPLARTDADEWRVDDHDGTVIVTYRIFGDRLDGTYLAIDTTHAHLNMPATFLWARGLEDRPIRVTFTPPAESGWHVATQLFPTASALTFTAPSLQYFMDSPVELSAFVESRFVIERPNEAAARFRVVAHTRDPRSAVDALAGMIARLVREHIAVWGVLPAFDGGEYTFLLDYLPWATSDGMEHRNSTVITSPFTALSTEAGRREALEAISHEFFHVWNVERLRPAGLEPFDFTRENVTCCLWLAEGFTQYYGELLLHRAGLSDDLPVGSVAGLMGAAGRGARSAVGMSEEAPFADAGLANDADDRHRTFVSYYTQGAALAFALDMAMREHSGGALSLDDLMRRLWREYGQSTSEGRPGEVARPYALADVRRVLGTVIGDRAFADDFFTRFIEGRETPDYEHFLGLSGLLLRRIAPASSSFGDVPVLEQGAGLLVGASRPDGRFRPVPFDAPLYAAGVDQGDVIISIDGNPATMRGWLALEQRAPGSRVALGVRRRDGREVSTSAVLVPDAAVRIVVLEPTAVQRRFRDDWLGSRSRTQ